MKKKIILILKKNHVVKAGIFGSFVRGEAKKRSDIDILIEFDKRKSLLDLAGLKVELEEKLGRRVDIGEYLSLHSLLKNKILEEEVRIYEKK